MKSRKNIYKGFMYLGMINVLGVIAIASTIVKGYKKNIECLKIEKQELIQEYEDKILSLKEEKFNLKMEIVSLETHNTGLELDLMNKKAKVKELKETINTSKLPVYNYSYSEVILLAKAVQAEAGVGNTEAQKMVTKVILNRVESGKFPSTIKEVIYQKRGKIPQFSVAYDGAIERQELKYETLCNVMQVLMFGYSMPQDVLYFYASYVKENWVNTLKVYKAVQGTTFCYDEYAE